MSVKKIGIQKNLGKQNLDTKRMLGPDKFWVQKVLDPKNVGSKKMLGPKNFWYKNFG